MKKESKCIFNKSRMKNELKKLEKKYIIHIDNINNILLVQYNKNITFKIKIDNSYPFVQCNYGIIINNLVLLNTKLNKLPIDIIEKIQTFINKELYIENIKKIFIDNDIEHDKKMNSIYNYDDIVKISPRIYIIDVIKNIIILLKKYNLLTILF
tara:strand:+ start:1093 stop:1554 length:462 start_codon:yes stop_codon:yes gene_type:complete